MHLLRSLGPTWVFCNALYLEVPYLQQRQPEGLCVSSWIGLTVSYMMCISIHIHEQYDTKQKTRGETAETNYFEVGSLPRRCRGRGGGKRAQKTPNTTKSWGAEQKNI